LRFGNNSVIISGNAGSQCHCLVRAVGNGADNIERKPNWAPDTLGNIKRSNINAVPITDDDAISLMNIKLAESFIAGRYQ
jgi:hypothetical protein